LWIDHLEELRSLASLLRDVPHEVIPLFGLPLLGLVVAGLCALRSRDHHWSSDHRSSDHGRRDSWRWIVCAAVLVMLIGIALFHVRSVSGANALAAALVPAALVRLWPAGPPFALGLRPAAAILALVFNPVALILAGQAANAGAGMFARERVELVSQGPGTCQRARDYAVLDTMPRGRVLAFIDAGPMILVQTPHTVLAAPYHRNNSGNLAMLEIMLGPPEDAVARLAALQIDYVAFCPGAAERHIYAQAAPNGLAASLAAGSPPAGLAPLDRGDHEIKVYRVQAQAARNTHAAGSP
jgi:hypothetical protein